MLSNNIYKLGVCSSNFIILSWGVFTANESHWQSISHKVFSTLYTCNYRYELVESESQWKEVQRRQAEGSTGIQQATVINSKESQPRPRSGYMNSGMETESEHSYHHRRKHRKHRYCPLSTCLRLILQYARIRLTYNRETFTVGFVILVICRKTKMHSCSHLSFVSLIFLVPIQKLL